MALCTIKNPYLEYQRLIPYALNPLNFYQLLLRISSDCHDQFSAKVHWSLDGYTQPEFWPKWKGRLKTVLSKDLHLSSLEMFQNSVFPIEFNRLSTRQVFFLTFLQLGFVNFCWSNYTSLLDRYQSIDIFLHITYFNNFLPKVSDPRLYD